MTTFETVTVKSEGLSVSRIVWRRFRRHMPGLVARVLDINQGLAEHGALLPVGATFQMPIDPPEAIPTTPIVNVWD